jgi:hypothetical protein
VTDNASVRAFKEGRPLLSGPSDLGRPSATSSWKTFLSVPIFVHVESPAGHGGGLVPVGVVTLASRRGLRGTDTPSMFASMESPAFESLKFSMIAIGRKLLNPALDDHDEDADGPVEEVEQGA